MKKLIMVVVLVLASCTAVHAGTSVSLQFGSHNSFISVQHRSHGHQRHHVRHRQAVIYQPVHDCNRGRGYHRPVVHRQEGRTYYIDDRSSDIIVVPSYNRYRIHGTRF